MAQTGGPDTAEARGQLVRQHRRERGLTQEQLAEQAGLSARGIQDLERGLAVPRRDTLERLIGALGLHREQRAVFEAAARPRPRRREVSVAGLESVGVPNTNLPRQLTSFVGREGELEGLQRLLRSTPLLTLMGAGASGRPAWRCAWPRVCWSTTTTGSGWSRWRSWRIPRWRPTPSPRRSS
jgi:transcriptional regulator with XRE-family HTH domain